ncbi:hypothetical protein FACS1894185_3700 [Betaproteobacteria bacterium]|nr:hypothetical protein AGMMS49545_02880 [Betaproteobacteria bacterium]GHU11077.1 hypothetical protein FACS1894185_3700 [Betaproteobacteria bacterium]GHU14652.1 hypothetical protein FACS189441_4790 [Betaproteobacteria bacterium]GHU47442.1 hypothetical protein AGMMS50289_22640 [Betaproteobacteria bacterium]
MKRENRRLKNKRRVDSRFRGHDGGGLKHRARGVSTVEYVLCALLAVLVLFTPYDGDQSVVDKFMEAIRDAHAAQVYAIGNPVVGSSVSFTNQDK